jgi:hypothetical protein
MNKESNTIKRLFNQLMNEEWISIICDEEISEVLIEKLINHGTTFKNSELRDDEIFVVSHCGEDGYFLESFYSEDGRLLDTENDIVYVQDGLLTKEESVFVTAYEELRTFDLDDMESVDIDYAIAHII